MQDTTCFPLHSLFGSSSTLNSCSVCNVEAKVKDHLFFIPKLNKAGKSGIILRFEFGMIVALGQKKKAQNTAHLMILYA